MKRLLLTLLLTTAFSLQTMDRKVEKGSLIENLLFCMNECKNASAIAAKFVRETLQDSRHDQYEKWLLKNASKEEVLGLLTQSEQKDLLCSLLHETFEEWKKEETEKGISSSSSNSSANNAGLAKENIWRNYFDLANRKAMVIDTSNPTNKDVVSVKLIDIAKQVRRENPDLGQEEIRKIIQAMILQQQNVQQKDPVLELPVAQQSANIPVNNVHLQSGQRAVFVSAQQPGQAIITQVQLQQPEYATFITVPQPQVFGNSVTAQQLHRNNWNQVVAELRQRQNNRQQPQPEPVVIPESVVTPEPEPVVVPDPVVPQPMPTPIQKTSFYANHKWPLLAGAGVLGGTAAIIMGEKFFGAQTKQIKILEAAIKDIGNAKEITLDAASFTRLTKENQTALQKNVQTFNEKLKSSKVGSSSVKNAQATVERVINSCIEQIKSKPVRSAGILSAAADKFGAFCSAAKYYACDKWTSKKTQTA